MTQAAGLPPLSLVLGAGHTQPEEDVLLVLHRRYYQTLGTIMDRKAQEHPKRIQRGPYKLRGRAGTNQAPAWATAEETPEDPGAASPAKPNGPTSLPDRSRATPADDDEGPDLQQLMADLVQQYASTRCQNEAAPERQAAEEAFQRLAYRVLRTLARQCHRAIDAGQNYLLERDVSTQVLLDDLTTEMQEARGPPSRCDAACQAGQPLYHGRAGRAAPHRTAVRLQAAYQMTAVGSPFCRSVEVQSPTGESGPQSPPAAPPVPSNEPWVCAGTVSGPADRSGHPQPAFGIGSRGRWGGLQKRGKRVLLTGPATDQVTLRPASSDQADLSAPSPGQGPPPGLVAHLEQRLAAGGSPAAEGDPTVVLQRWHVYRGCLEAFIAASPLHQPFLREILRGCDALAERLRDTLRQQGEEPQPQASKTIQPLHVEHLQMQLETQAREVERLRGELRGQAAAAKALEEQLEEQRRLGTADGRLDHRRTARLLVAKTCQYKDVAEKAGALQRQLDTLEEEMAAQEDSRAAMCREFDAMIENFSSCNAELRDVKAQLQRTVAEKGALLRENDALKRQLQKLTSHTT
eukprot:EG_transcript_6851